MSEKMIDEYFEYLGTMQNTYNTMDSKHNFSLLEMSREQRGVFRLDFSPPLNHVLFKIIFFMVATSFVFCLAILAAFLMLKMIVWIRNSLEVSLAPGR